MINGATHSQSDFNPRTPCGVRPSKVVVTASRSNFNPRTPCGVRPLWSRAQAQRLLFQSTHPVRGATWQKLYEADKINISIHAPRAGCDPQGIGTAARHQRISIHAPRAGCDQFGQIQVHKLHDFNPRTPCGVRRRSHRQQRRWIHFNPRTPCGVRLAGVGPVGIFVAISIHAPRAGCDDRLGGLLFPAQIFQSTHPVRGATGWRCHQGQQLAISIQAPRAGCDMACLPCSGSRIHFNPRTPCGVRLGFRTADDVFAEISIHAPRAGCDFGDMLTMATDGNFNPRTPCGVRPSAELSCFLPALFQSTHPVRGATQRDQAWALQS